MDDGETEFSLLADISDVGMDGFLVRDVLTLDSGCS